MKDLKEYIKEGLFDDVDKLEGKNGLKYNSTQLKKEIIDWIVRNTSESVYKSKFKFDMTTALITVNYSGSIGFKTNITSLTNGNFQWGYVSGSFNCYNCKSLTNLEGAPKKVMGDFCCNFCHSLKSLEGAPKEVGRHFVCYYCESLEFLKNYTEKVGGLFDCSNCKSLKSLEGAPKVVGGDFYCGSCTSLKTLKGSPKEVGGEFACYNCGTQFTEEYVKQVSNIKRKMYV